MRVLPSHLRAAIRAARTHAQGKRLPIDVKAIAREVGIVRIEPRNMRADGYLGQSERGALVIRYRLGTCQERLRFTIAHETAHILLAQAQGREVADPSFRTEGTSSEERTVNRIAAELLMPESLFRARVQG